MLAFSRYMVDGFVVVAPSGVISFQNVNVSRSLDNIGSISFGGVVNISQNMVFRPS